jgi:type IV pilus assembly protein PilY1
MSFTHKIVVALSAMLAIGSSAAVDLADAPLFTTVSVPGNLALALSVEWPTATTPAYVSTTAYSASTTYVGYFDPLKCYTYNYNSTTPANSYFKPYGLATNHLCTSSATALLWSGNYMNWATMQTLDVFRWALTGGYRTVDTTTDTVITKTYADSTGGGSIVPDKTVSVAATVAGSTPFTWSSATTSIKNRGVSVLITSTNAANGTGDSAPTYGCVSGSKCLSTNTNTIYAGHNSYVTSTDSLYANPATVYQLYVNVLVCDATMPETNCTVYGSNYKPEGLMQKYASKLRFSAFGYLNDSTANRDGGVMRAPMKYIGPLQPVPGSSDITNTIAEWDGTTGIMALNPDSTLATATTTATGVTITKSGVMNYLNKFGLETSGSRYKSYDPVSELYYAITRYFRNIGNVASYSDLSSASAANKKQFLDGFPIITTWSDPIVYSCQKNFILGIGDVNTHRDANLPGSTLAVVNTNQEPTMPTEVTADNTTNGVDVVKSTKMVAQLEGLSSTIATSFLSSGRFDTYYIAGLAYDVHTKDMRSDLTGSQTINTYWVDVKEAQTYLSKNEYWLAAKYGGFTVPSGFSTYATTNGTSTLSLTDWYTTTDLVGSDKRPDNYFLADQGSTMVTALNAAFSKIATELTSATTTAFSSATRKNTQSGNANYSGSYDPSNWTGKVIGSSLSYDADYVATLTDVWDGRALLETLTPSSRKIVTCCTATGAGLAFTSTALAGSLSSRTYVTSFANVPGASSQSTANFIAYLRGDHAQEVKNGGAYRNRSYRLGDIVNSKVTAVAAPIRPFYDTKNPGYSTFKKTWASRSTVAFAGSNDGMLHAFDGSLTSSTKGLELFAYIPSFAYGDSSSTSDRYFATYGLASLGNPNYVHHFMVDATPVAFDIDLNNTSGATSSTPNWRTVLIGGMGKGGKGYYAIDVTDPTSWTSETAVAGKVLWEFTDSRMGYSYGDPHVVKTAKYGWVVLLTSGYNNSDGKGYLFIVNPRTGTLLEAIATTEGDATNPINMAQLRTFIPNVSDYTADAAYAGDLRGNIWRFNLTGTAAYSSPLLMARLTSSTGAALPITTAPMIGVDPTTNKRYVMVGTGKLLASSDITGNTGQSFYAFVDGTNKTGGFYTSSTIPSGYTYPLSRSKLSALLSLTTGLGSETSAMGWYYDITGGMTVDGDVFNGIVAFGVNVPSGNVCTPSGTSIYYAIRFASGVSALVNNAGTLIESVANSNGIVTEVSVQSVNGKILVAAGDSSGKVQTLKLPDSATTLQRLNWREISTID